jgi:hypothetical protein
MYEGFVISLAAKCEGIDNHHRHHYHIVCTTTGPQNLPQRVLHRGQTSASYLFFPVPSISLRSSCSCLRLLPRLIVPSIFPFIVIDSVKCNRFIIN